MTPNGHSRRRVQPKEDRTKNNEFNHESLDEDDDLDFSQRIYSGKYIEAQKREKTVDGDLLVTRRALSIQPKDDGVEEQ